MRHTWTHPTILLSMLVILAGGASAAWGGSHSALSPEFSVDTRSPVTPDGGFTAEIGAVEVTGGRGLWDLTGRYTTSVGVNPLELILVHDTLGRLSGTGVYRLAGAVPVDVPLLVKGSVKGNGGALLATLTLGGANAAGKVSVSLSCSLSLNAATLELSGPVTGRVKVNGLTTGVSQILTLDLPPLMDGTWTLAFQLHQAGKKITGTATLTLSNTVGYDFVVQGRVSGARAVLSLAGDPSDPVANAIKIKTTLTPLEGGWARLESFSGTGYGQRLGW